MANVGYDNISIYDIAKASVTHPCLGYVGHMKPVICMGSKRLPVSVDRN